MHLYDFLQKREIIPYNEAKRISIILNERVDVSSSITSKYFSLINNIDMHFRTLRFSETFLSFEDMLKEFVVFEITTQWTFKECFLYFEIIATYLNCLKEKIYPSLRSKCNLVLSNIKIIVDKSGYEIFFREEDNFALIVEKNKLTTEAIETTDNVPLALELLEYNRFSLKGNVEAKRKVLNLIANHIEPLQKSNTFNGTAYSSLNNDVGFYLNNFNIRHNNVEGKSKQDFLITMPPEELEAWYDDIYSSFLMLIIAEKQLKIHSNLEKLKQDMKK